MTLNEYQAKALTTDTFEKNLGLNALDAGFLEKVLGLVGESGEFADKIKKLIRDNDGVLADDTRKELIKELGDVLWYVASLTHYLGYDFEQTGQINLDKLADRAARGVIQSSGDNR